MMHGVEASCCGSFANNPPTEWGGGGGGGGSLCSTLVDIFCPGSKQNKKKKSQQFLQKKVRIREIEIASGTVSKEDGDIRRQWPRPFTHRWWGKGKKIKLSS